MATITESSWPQGWVPDHSKQEEVGSQSNGLLRMDNLTLDEKGSLRICKGPTILSDSAFATSTALFGAYANSKKYRYLYTSGGTLLRNYDAAGLNTLTNYGLAIFTGATSPNSKCCFLNALGHVFAIAGDKKYKDNFTAAFPLGIPVPTAPTVTNNSAPSITGDLSVAYTSIESASFSAASTTGFTATPNATSLRVTSQSVSASTFDFTNFGGGTGHDTPDDAFYFNFEIDDADQLSYIKIEFYNETTPVTNYYWKEFDFNTGIATDTLIAAGLAPFNITSGVTLPVRILRSEFSHIGADPTKDWHNIKAVRVTVGFLASTSITFNNITVKGSDTGPLSGTMKYVVVEVRDTGQNLEFSPASATVEVETASSSVHVDRSGTAVNAQANQIWTFRRDDATGFYLAVNRQSGANGFTPAAFDDKVSDDTAIESAASNPQFTLQPFRTLLPDTIIGMIYFRDRIMYLTTSSFIPSYKLDPGTYDSRYIYELAGTVSETCLFIVKLDVGTFIVATTRDFYRITGTFNELDDGTTTFLDVNIYPLGVTDPAIHSSFVEIGGTILYMSSTGIRSLNNATSTLLNGNLDLLFRGETRHGIPSIPLTALSNAVIACATSGNRIYWSLPFSDSMNRVVVQNLSADGSYFRLMTDSTGTIAPKCMFREEDGTIIYASAGGLNYMRSMESAFANSTIHFLSKFKYGESAETRKDVEALVLYIDTGTTELDLNIYGLMDDGQIIQRSYTIKANGETVIYLDPKEHLAAALAFAIEIYGTTNTFVLNYWTIQYSPHAALVRRKTLLLAAGDKFARRSLTAWPFRINPMGGEVVIRVFKDGTIVDNPVQQSYMGNRAGWYQWTSNIQEFGYNWEIQLTSSKDFEFYEFGQPTVSQENPTPLKRVKIPYDALGKAGRKTIGTWPFRLNTIGAATVDIYVRADGFEFTKQTIAAGTDLIRVLEWISNTNTLAVAWEIELISDTVFEFYEFLQPVITQECPTPTLRAVAPSDNLGKSNRKRLGTWPFKINPLGADLTVTPLIDNAVGSAQSITGTIDGIETLFWNNIDAIIGLDWGLEIIASTPMEFYGFLQPIIVQEMPPKTYYAIMPFTNFGKPNLKKIATLPFVVDGLGHTILSKVTTESGELIPAQSFSGNGIGTEFWRNTRDLAAVDWQLELICADGMEFYKFHSPEILQIFPMGKLIDQVGPLDLNATGLVYGMRLRVLPTTGFIHYKVYDADTLVYENNIATTVNIDQAYIEPFPKGIDPAVCRIILTSPTVFYRFSLEFKVRITGKETDERYIKIKDANSNS